MLNKEIEKAIGEFNDSPIAKYYDKYGEKRATQNAVSSLRMKHKMPNIRKAKTETKFPKELLKKLHKECKTRTELMNKTNLSNGAYERLCKLYKLKEKKYDKTTKNAGPSEPTYVYKLNEVKRELYNSTKDAGRNLFGKQKMPTIYREDISEYEGKKIPFQLDINGRMIRCKLTGNTSTLGNRDASNEVQVYELLPELIPYSKKIIVFPSVNEIERYFEKNICSNKVPSVRAVLVNKIYQSMGHFFTIEIIKDTKIVVPIKKRKKTKFNNIIVTKLVLVPHKTYDSIGWVKKDLFGIGRGKDVKRMSIQILDVLPNISEYEGKKIPFYIDEIGNRWMFVRTGRKTLVWPNASKTADEVQSYKLEDEIVQYSNSQIEFPTEDEIFEKFKTIYSIIGCIKGNIFHSKGLRFKIK